MYEETFKDIEQLPIRNKTEVEIVSDALHQLLYRVQDKTMGVIYGHIPPFPGLDRLMFLEERIKKKINEMESLRLEFIK